MDKILTKEIIAPICIIIGAIVLINIINKIIFIYNEYKTISKTVEWKTTKIVLIYYRMKEE